MKIETIEVNITNGYAGSSPKCEAIINGEKYILDRDYICAYISTLIQNRGFEVKKTNRQQINRLIIN